MLALLQLLLKTKRNIQSIDSQDVANKLSKLTTDLSLLNEFHAFIENLISTSGYLYEYTPWSDITSSSLITHDLFSLIEASIYISDLAGLSVAIPSESYTFNFTNFAIYIARVSNSSVNTTLPITSGNSSTTAILASDDTDEGRDSFELTHDVLDSIDIVMFSIATQDGVEVNWQDGGGIFPDGCNNNDNDNNNGESDSDVGNSTGYIASEEVTVIILSGNGSSLVHNLTSNLVLIFENINANWSNSEENHACVWYDQTHDRWDTEGCVTLVDEITLTVNCSCGHLTKFAILSTLSQDPSDTEGCTTFNGLDLNDALGISDYIVYICCLFIACLCGIFMFVSYKSWILLKMNLFRKYKEKQDSFNGIIYSGACAFFEMVGCIMVAIYSMDTNVRESEVYIETLTIVLGLPLLFYFLMFTRALHGWVIVARSIDQNVNGHDERNKFLFDAIKWIVICMFLTLVILMVFDIDSQFSSLFLLCEIIWLIVMCIACTLFTFYSLKLRHVLSKTLNVVHNVNDKQQAMEEKQIIKRLTVVSILLSSFFLIQTCIALYGVYIQISSLKYDISLPVLDLFLNIIYLCSFLYLYIPNVNRVIETEERSYVYITIDTFSNI